LFEIKSERKRRAICILYFLLPFPFSICHGHYRLVLVFIILFGAGRLDDHWPTTLTNFYLQFQTAARTPDTASSLAQKPCQSAVLSQVICLFVPRFSLWGGMDWVCVKCEIMPPIEACLIAGRPENPTTGGQSVGPSPWPLTTT
jgi:hypothetical protein